MRIMLANSSRINMMKMDGYSRRAFRTGMMGTIVKNISTICHFNLVAFQNRKNKHDVLVEIRWGKGTKIDMGIDPKWMKTFIAGTKWEDMFVEIDGRSFIVGDNGEAYLTSTPSVHNVNNSNAFSFLEQCGDALATGFAFPDRATTLEDGFRMALLLNQVRDYAFSSRKGGKYECESLHYQKKIEHCLSNIETIEHDQRSDHEEYNSGIEVLRNYGIEYKEK